MRSALPPQLERFRGRIMDVDAHEMMPTNMWVDEFGDVAADLVEAYKTSFYATPGNPNSQYLPDFEHDDVPITPENVWTIKGARAPSAADLRRRVDVLDLTGVARQLVFPGSAGLIGSLLRTGGRGFPSIERPDLVEYTDELFAAHNEWVVRAQQFSPRIRPVAIVQGSSVAHVLEIAQGLIANGVRTFQFMACELLGGVSPAHPDLDALWESMATNGVVGTLHIGSEGTFLRTDAWANAAAFDNYKRTLEIHVTPWHMSMIHLPAQNFIATLVTGGVFARHPDLRFGAIEVAAHWIGPLASQLDMWYENGFVTRRGDKNPVLEERPSEYIRRNVRVSAFDFEPVDEYIKQYGLKEVYCYASDFPHVEGGYEPMVRFVEQLEPLGDEIVERFFVTNGELLLPA